jgi:hypothetical protein
LPSRGLSCRRGIQILIVVSTLPMASATAQAPEAAGTGPTRLFFGPTARSVPRGEGSVGLTEVLFPWVEIGLTDRLSLRGIGTFPLEEVSDGGLTLAPKIQVLRRRKVQAAIGVAHSFSGGDDGGIGYGVVTLGGSDGAVTIGYGYGYGSLADSQGSPAVLFLGADKSLGAGFRFVLEAYVGGAGLGMPDQTLMVGTRYGRGPWKVDVGIVIPFYETGGGTPGPVLTIARSF